MSVNFIMKLKEGDHSVFKLVYDDWNRKVYHYFLSKTGDRDVAKELTQQLFIKCWKYRESLSIELTLDQQLFQKVRLIYIDWLRMQATKRKYFATDFDITSEPFLSPEASGEAITDEIASSLNSLSPKRRKVFELKHLHGYSYKEIAAHLGITVKTVDNHLLKATSQLRKVFNL